MCVSLSVREVHSLNGEDNKTMGLFLGSQNTEVQLPVRVDDALAVAQNALHRGDTLGALKALEQAQQRNWLVKWQTGHIDDDASPSDHHEEGPRQSLCEPADLPLELLASEANQRYAQHLRLAYEALVEVERERGLYAYDGPSEILSCWLEQAEQEVYGPKGSMGAE